MTNLMWEKGEYVVEEVGMHDAVEVDDAHVVGEELKNDDHIDRDCRLEVERSTKGKFVSAFELSRRSEHD